MSGGDILLCWGARKLPQSVQAAGMELRDRAVECLIAEDLEGIAARFEQMYEECVANVKKVACHRTIVVAPHAAQPNVLVAGITGTA